MFSKWSSYFFGSDAADAAADNSDAVVVAETKVERAPEQKSANTSSVIVKKPKKKDNQQQQQQQKKKKNGALNKKSAVATNSKTAAAATAASAIVEPKTQPGLLSSDVSGDEEDWILVDDQQQKTEPVIAEILEVGVTEPAAVVDVVVGDDAVVVDVEQEEQEEMVVLEAEKEDVDGNGNDDGDDGEEVSIVDMTDMYKDDVDDPELISLDEANVATDTVDDSWCVTQVGSSKPASPTSSTSIPSRFIPSKQLEMDAFRLPSFTSRLGGLVDTGLDVTTVFCDANYSFFRDSDSKENCEPHSFMTVSNAVAVILKETAADRKFSLAFQSSSPAQQNKDKVAAVVTTATAPAPIASAPSTPAAAAAAGTKPPKTAKKRNRYLNVVVPSTQLVPNTNRSNRFDLYDDYDCNDLMTNPMKNYLKLSSSQQQRINKRERARFLPSYQTRHQRARTERSRHFMMYDDY